MTGPPGVRDGAGDLPPLTYLTVDSVIEGIGLSQVFRYVERLAGRGLAVTLHSFERLTPPTELFDRMDAADVDWHVHRFRPGAAAGAARVALGAALLARSELVHARSDMAAASSVLSRRPAWVWDVRSFWREQRVEMGLLNVGSPYDRVMASVERASARKSSAIVTLSRSAADVLGSRYGDEVATKSHVITTCVDLDRFASSPFPSSTPVRFLLAGTLNLLYDVPCMLRLVERMRSRRPAELTVLEPAPSPWDGQFRDAGLEPRSAAPADMPARVAAHHVGFSVLRANIGISLCAVTPTKIGEFLASGRPVVVNGGVGDLDTLLAKFDCGVVVRECTDASLDDAVDQLEGLLEDEGTPARCRALAEEHFNLDNGVTELIGAYREAVGLDAGCPNSRPLS